MAWYTINLFMQKKKKKKLCYKQWWARYFLKVPRYQYLLEKSTVGTSTILKKYHGTGTSTRYRYFLMTQLNCNRNVGERLLLEILIFCEKEHDKLRSRATIYFREKSTFQNDRHLTQLFWVSICLSQQKRVLHHEAYTYKLMNRNGLFRS